MFVHTNTTGPGQLLYGPNQQSCLDLWGGSGPNVGKYTCNGGPNQLWTVLNGTIASGASTDGTDCMSDVHTSNGGGMVRTINAYTDAPAIRLLLNGRDLGTV